MNTTFVKWISGWIVLIVITCQLSTVKASTDGLCVLKFPMSARAIGMGEAVVSTPDGINGIFYNPAGLSLVNRKEFIVSYLKLIAETNYVYIGYLQRMSNFGVLGVGVVTLQSGEMEINYFDKPTRKVTAQSDYIVVLSNGFNLRQRLSVGSNLKVIQSKLAEEATAQAYALDFGILFETPRDMNIGISLQNLGTKVKYKEKKDALPFSLKGGVSHKIHLFPDIALTLAADLIASDDGKYKTNVGVECLIVEPDIEGMRAYFRGGYQPGYEPKRFALGIGLVDRNNYYIDYAYCLLEDLGNNHYISLRAKF